MPWKKHESQRALSGWPGRLADYPQANRPASIGKRTAVHKRGFGRLQRVSRCWIVRSMM